MDKYDRGILRTLQTDADVPIATIAEQIGLSTNACWRRVKRLREDGVIRRSVALLDEQALGLNVTVFVSVKTNHHSAEWLAQFAAGIRDIPEIVEFYRLSGEVDYLLKIVVRDIEDYDRVYKELIRVAPLQDVSSSFAMERIKSSTALPLTHIGS